MYSDGIEHLHAIIVQSISILNDFLACILLYYDYSLIIYWLYRTFVWCFHVFSTGISIHSKSGTVGFPLGGIEERDRNTHGPVDLPPTISKEGKRLPCLEDVTVTCNMMIFLCKWSLVEGWMWLSPYRNLRIWGLSRYVCWIGMTSFLMVSIDEVMKDMTCQEFSITNQCRKCQALFTPGRMSLASQDTCGWKKHHFRVELSKKHAYMHIWVPS